MEEGASREPQEAFDEGSSERDYVKDYLAEVRTNWREVESSAFRTAGLIIGTAVIFELIFANGVDEADFLFVKLTKFSFVEFALPIIIAFWYHGFMLSAISSQLLEDTHTAVIGKVYPMLKSTTYLMPLHPPNTLAYGDVTELISAAGRRPGALVSFSLNIRAIFIGITPPVFLVAAYIQLLQGELFKTFALERASGRVRHLKKFHDTPHTVIKKQRLS